MEKLIVDELQHSLQQENGRCACGRQRGLQVQISGFFQISGSFAPIGQVFTELHELIILHNNCWVPISRSARSFDYYCWVIRVGSKLI